MENKTTLLQQFIRLQDMQLQLDKKKNQYKVLGSEIRSIGQKLPELLRKLDLK